MYKVKAQNIFFASFLILVFLSALLPSGMLFGLPARTLILTITLGTWLVCIIKQSNIKTKYFDDLKPFLLILVIAFIWSFISIFITWTSPVNILLHQVTFLITFLLPIIGIFLLNIKDAGKSIVRSAIYGYVLLSLLKTLFLVGVFFKLVSVGDVFDIFERVFGFSPISMVIADGVLRLQFVNDVLAPFILFILISDTFNLRFSRALSFIFITLVLVSLFLSFSRMLIALGVVNVFMSIFIVRATIKKYLMVFVGGGLILFIAILNHQVLGEIVEKRFFSDQAVESDYQRYKQFDALIFDWDKYPILGKGTGSNADNVLRSRENPFSYELQLIATFMQFGAIGGLAVVFSLMMIINRTIIRLNRFKEFFIFSSYTMFLFSMFSNPYLYSMTSGILFLLYYLAANQDRYH